MRTLPPIFRRTLFAIFTSCFLHAQPCLAIEPDIPVEVREQHGIARQHELVSLSVPLAETAAIHGTLSLKLTDAAGMEVPAQWRVLTRWRGVPGDVSRPIKFALVKFFVDLAPNQAKDFRIRPRLPADGPPALPSPMVSAFVSGGVATVDTGVLQVDLDPNLFSGFNGVRMDLDGNGVIAPNELIVSPATSVGALLVDTLGGVYLQGMDSHPQYDVEEIGPLQLVVRVKGLHQPFTANNIGRDFLKWTTRLYFEAGSSAVRVEHTLGNTYLDNPLGNIGLARYALHTRLRATNKVFVTFGGEGGAALPAMTPSLTEEALLYQDSCGLQNWQKPGTTFPGWRAWQRGYGADPLRPETQPTEAPAAAGQMAGGWMDVADASKGILVALRYAWQSYPFALRAYADGSMVADLWPAEFQGLQWIDDAQRKTHELTYVFHKGPINGTQEAARRTNPVRPWIPLEYTQSTRAWADHGYLRDVQDSPEVMMAEGAKQLKIMNDAFEDEFNYGCLDFGEPIWYQNTHSPGSWRNRLSWFDRFMTCGGVAWFELSELFALHSMDVRTYHIDGFTKEAHPNTHLLEGIPHYTGSDLLGRNTIPAAYDAYKIGVAADGHGWNGFDPEHMTADDLYEYYLMTGSFNALDALVSMGEAMNTWKDLASNKPILNARSEGWTLRALMKVYAVTGDVRYLHKAEDIVLQIKIYRGQASSPTNGIVYHYLARNKYGGDKHGMTEEFEQPWQVAVGIYGLALYGRDSGDASVDPIISELSSYLIDYCMFNDVFVDALACDNHIDLNPKSKNDGVNTWIASALAIAYRSNPNPVFYQKAKLILDQNTSAFLDADNFYHWYHDVGTLVDSMIGN